MKIEKRQLVSAIIAVCVLVLCVILLIRNGFVLRIAVAAVLSLVWACISTWAAIHPDADTEKES